MLIFFLWCAPTSETNQESLLSYQESWDIVKDNEIFSGTQHKEFYECKNIRNKSCIFRVKEVENGYSYMFTFSKDANVEWKWKIPPITLEFFSREEITEDDIEEDQQAGTLSIPKLNFFLNYNAANKNYDFGLRCFWDFNKNERKENLPLTVIFPSGSWEKIFLSPHKELSDSTFPYINYLSESTWWFNREVFPEYLGLDPVQADHFGKDDCVIVLGKIQHFPNLPFHLDWGFTDATLAVTQNKTDSSKCKELLGHEWTLEFYNDEVVCTLWFDQNTSLKSIAI